MKKLLPILALSLISCATLAGKVIITSNNSNQDSKLATYFDEMMVKTNHDEIGLPGFIDNIHGTPNYTIDNVSSLKINWIGLNGVKEQFNQINLNCEYTVGDNEIKRVNIYVTGTVNTVLGIDTRTAICQEIVG